MTTASGLRPISQIAVGDLVLAWDETTRSTGYYTVTAVMLHTDVAQVHLSVGDEHVETTPEHPFYTLERGWVAAGDLWDGAHVRRADGSYALTLVLWVDAEPQVMYNLTVATAHTFFVGVERALVHNAGWKCGLLSERKIDELVRRLRKGEDVYVKSIEQARQLLDNLPELEPGRGNYTESPDSVGTYRGDLRPTYKKFQDDKGQWWAEWEDFVHPPDSVSKSPAHAYSPHYNLYFINGIKAAILIE